METCGNRESDFIAWRAAGTNREARVTAAVGTVRTCSACAGDYEDPDRTASRECELDDVEDDGRDIDAGLETTTNAEEAQ